VAATLDALALDADMEAVREGYAAARVAWVELLADAEVDPALGRGRAEVRRRARPAGGRSRGPCRGRSAAELRRREQADRIAGVRAHRSLVVRRADGSIAEGNATSEGMPPSAEAPSPTADALADRLAEARATWEGMPPMPQEWAAELEQRFAAACRAAEKREERRKRAADLADRLPLIVPEIEALVVAEDYGPCATSGTPCASSGS
jgi:hypothetical protein